MKINYPIKKILFSNKRVLQTVFFYLKKQIHLMVHSKNEFYEIIILYDIFIMAFVITFETTGCIPNTIYL